MSSTSTFWGFTPFTDYVHDYTQQKVLRGLTNVCTLVGPTKHYRAFDYCSYRLGRLGWLVFSVGSHRADDSKLKTTDKERQIYWTTHRMKLNLSSMAYVVDLPSMDEPAAVPYVGNDTMGELTYCKSLDDIEVRYMSDGVFPLPKDHPNYSQAKLKEMEATTPNWDGRDV